MKDSNLSINCISSCYFSSFSIFSLIYFSSYSNFSNISNFVYSSLASFLSFLILILLISEANSSSTLFLSYSTASLVLLIVIFSISYALIPFDPPPPILFFKIIINLSNLWSNIIFYIKILIYIELNRKINFYNIIL